MCKGFGKERLAGQRFVATNVQPKTKNQSVEHEDLVSTDLALSHRCGWRVFPGGERMTGSTFVARARLNSARVNSSFAKAKAQKVLYSIRSHTHIFQYDIVQVYKRGVQSLCGIPWFYLWLLTNMRTFTNLTTHGTKNTFQAFKNDQPNTRAPALARLEKRVETVACTT